MSENPKNTIHSCRKQFFSYKDILNLRVNLILLYEITMTSLRIILNKIGFCELLTFFMVKFVHNTLENMEEQSKKLSTSQGAKIKQYFLIR